MATLQGVYRASVLDSRDPEGLARVRVRVAGMTDAEEGVESWARVAATIGQARGAWVLPDQGDEVLVSFEHGDARAPYVIGALWEATSNPPLTRDPDSMTVETARGQRLVLRDSPGSVHIQDAHGNAVTLSPSGITIAAAGSVTITASIVKVSAGLLTVDAGMSQFSGVVQCDTLVSNAVVSASYSPGVGNQQ